MESRNHRMVNIHRHSFIKNKRKKGKWKENLFARQDITLFTFLPFNFAHYGVVQFALTLWKNTCKLEWSQYSENVCYGGSLQKWHSSLFLSLSLSFFSTIDRFDWFDCISYWMRSFFVHRNKISSSSGGGMERFRRKKNPWNWNVENIFKIRWPLSLSVGIGLLSFHFLEK